MSPKTKIIVAGAVVTALIGLIVIDLATSPERRPAPPERNGTTTARTPRPPHTPPPPAGPIVREIIPLPGPDTTPLPGSTVTTAPSTTTPTVRSDLREIESSFLHRQETPTTPAIPDDVPPPDRPSEYTVVANDSFWKVAGKVYGDASLFHLIQAANPTVGEHNMMPGAKLQIPAKPARRTATVRPSPRGSAEPRARDANVEVYTIKPKDVLWNIAKPYAKARGMQVPAMVQAIRDANPGLDPDRLKVAAEIVIPR